MTDLTRGLIEDVLAVNDNSAQRVLSALGVAVYTTDANGVLTFYNEAAAELWGRRPELGVDLWCGSWRILRPDGAPLPHDQCPMAYTLKGDRPIRGEEAILVRPDGRHVWFLPYPTPLHDEAGNLIGAVNVIVDITQQKQAELATLASEQRLRDFFDNSPMAMSWLNQNGTILRANRAELAMLGYTEEEYAGRNIVEFHVDRAAGQELLARIGRGEDVRDFEATLRASDGTLRQVLIDASEIRQEGRFLYTSCLTRDVTEKLKADDAVVHLAAIVGSSDDAIVSKDLNGIVSSWNPGAERLFGYAADEIIGKSIRTIIPFELQAEEDEVLRRVRSGEPVDHFETMRRHKDGSLIPVSVTVSPVRDVHGRIVGASKIARDITERKRAEEEMQAAALLKDQFLGLVSHELRTPISTIIANALILQRRGDRLSEADRAQAVQDIVAEGGKLQSVIENLLLLTRIEASSDLRLATARLPEVMSQQVKAFGRSRPQRIVELRVDPELDVVRGGSALLAIVLENLLSNADKYSPFSAAILVTATRNEQGEAEVHVLDYGIGIEESDMENLFTPFYRSHAAKGQAGGLGLGLAVCKRIIEAYGGRIWAAQRPEGGADFAFTLPSK